MRIQLNTFIILGIFRTSPFGEAVLNNKICLPPRKRLPGSQIVFPHYFVGDAAFPLKENLMRPYAGSNLERQKNVFNYRLSRARRVIENSFGILTARWRILLTTIELEPQNCEKIVLACIVLHNFIMLNDHQRWYCPPNFIDYIDENGSVQDGGWRNVVRTNGDRPLQSFATYSRRSSEAAVRLRDNLANYFENEGAIPNQMNII